MIKNKRLTAFLVLMIFLCSFISYKAGKNSAAVFNKTTTTNNTTDQDNTDYGKFQSFVNSIKEKYYFNIDYEKMNTEIKKAIFSSLGDPYTQYLTEKDMKELQKVSSGKFVGIGVQVSVNENGEIVVVAPIKGGPSQKAGIQSEDIIVKVNDEEVKKNDLESTIKLMRGNEEVGSEVKVTVKRIVDSEEKILDFTIKRE